MSSNGIPIMNEDLAEEFAKMFENKIINTVSSVSISNDVYNGTHKINEQNKNLNTFKIKCKKLLL